MNIVSLRIGSVIAEKKIPYADMEKLTGIPRSALHRYATGGTDKIPVDRVEKIAKALDVRAEYLMGWEEQERETDLPQHPFSLAYEKAPQREKSIVRQLLEPYIDNTIDFPLPENVTLIDPSMPTCAGTGNPLDDNMEYGEIKVIKNKYTYGATHVIKLSGDSMEPEFHDGDRLIVTAVKYGEKPIFGRVGIFLVNGSSYLRQPLDGRLHPYNPDYEDIVPGEDDRVDYVGYVVGILDDSWVIST